MTRSGNRRGSVLVMALWIIAVLSVIVMSFAFEARQQAGIDIYVRERNRARRLIDSGRVLGEAVLLSYQDVQTPEIESGKPDWKDIFEDDRWCVEKYDLKTDHKCTIGPIDLEGSTEDDEDAEGADPATITVELAFESAEPKIDINSLCEEKDKNYAMRWQTILSQCGIDEELEVEVADANRGGKKSHNLMNLLIASWKDWRDEDDSVSKGPLSDSDYNPQEDDGAEKSWYEERDEEDEIPVKDRRVPANGPIKKLEELSYIRGFRDFPSILTGGRLYDGTDLAGKYGKDDENNPMLTGIMDRFKVSGGVKLELNDQTRKEDLSTIPGIFPDDPTDQDAQEDCDELIEAILGALKTKPEDENDVDETRTWWPFKSFDDLCKRVDDFGCDLEVPSGIQEYIKWPGDTSGGGASAKKSSKSKNDKSTDDVEKFSMTITGESFGMKCVVKARCVISDKKVQYIEWSENELTNETDRR